MIIQSLALDPPRSRSAGLLSRRTQRRLTIGFGAALILTFSLGPFLWLADASVTPEPKADFAHPCLSTRAVVYFPTQPTLGNYVQLFQQVPFATLLARGAAAEDHARAIQPTGSRLAAG